MSWIRRKCCALAVFACLTLALPAPAADVDPELPNDTDIVAHVNVRQLLASALVQKYALEHMRKELKSVLEADVVLDELGLDPFTEIAGFTLAAPGGADPNRVLLIAHGKFKLDKFKARAEDAVKEGGPLKIVPMGDYTIYEVNPPEGPVSDVYVALPDDHTFLASPEKNRLLDALDKHAGKKKSEINPDLKARIAKLGAAESAWIVALTTGLEKGPIGTDPTAKKEFLDRSVTVSGSVRVGQDVVLNAVIAAKSEQDASEIAKKLTELGDQGKAILVAFAQSNNYLAPLIEVAKSLNVVTEGKTVTQSVTISTSVIEKMLQR